MMESIFPDVELFIDEGKMDMASKKLHEHLAEAVSKNDYRTATMILIYLSSVESTVTSNPLDALPFLDIALLYSKRTDDRLRPEIQEKRFLLLLSKGDESGARESIEDALEWSRQQKDSEWETKLLEHQVLLDVLENQSSQGRLGPSSINVADRLVKAHQNPQDLTNQLRALISIATIVAIRNPGEAITLLGRAETLLDNAEDNLLKPFIDRSVLIQIPMSKATHIQLPYQRNRVNDEAESRQQWRSYIQQQREWIMKMTLDNNDVNK